MFFWITIIVLFLLGYGVRLYKNFIVTPKDLTSKKVLITGASGVLGKLLVEQFLKQKCEVIGWDVRSESLKEMINEFSKKGLDVSKLKTDVVEVSSKQAVDEAAKKVGSIDILVQNAGIVIGKSILELKEEEIRKVMDVNGICHYWTIQAFVPDMIKRNSGNVVTVASNAAYFSLPYMSEYAASKGAAVAISNCLRLELRKMNSDVKVLVVCPAYMKTPMFSGFSYGNLVSKIVRELDPAEVALNIVDAVRKDIPHLLLPSEQLGAAAINWLLPLETQLAMMGMLGYSDLMDNFKGRGSEVTSLIGNKSKQS